MEPKSGSDQARNFGLCGTHGRSSSLGQRTCIDRKDMSLCALSSHDQTSMSARAFPTHRSSTQCRCCKAGHPHWLTKNCRRKSHSSGPLRHHRDSPAPCLWRTSFFLCIQETPPRSATFLRSIGCTLVPQVPTRPRNCGTCPDRMGHKAGYQSKVGICQVGTPHTQATPPTTMQRFRCGTCLLRTVCILLCHGEAGNGRSGSRCKQPAPWRRRHCHSDTFPPSMQRTGVAHDRFGTYHLHTTCICLVR